jgi:hypothetical protein
LFQTVEKKQEFISQIMTNKSPVRACEDIDADALSYAEIKALCAGNPLIKEKMELDVEVQKLKILKTQYNNQSYRLQDDCHKRLPERIISAKERIVGYKADISRISENTKKVSDGISPMVVGGTTFTDRKEAGEAIISASRNVKGLESVCIGEYKGFEMSVIFDSFNEKFICHLKGEMTYKAELSQDPIGCITRINNALENMHSYLENNIQTLEELETQLIKTEKEMSKPFPQEAEYIQKTARLAEVEKLLTLDTQPMATEGEAPSRGGATPTVVGGVYTISRETSNKITASVVGLNPDRSIIQNPVDATKTETPLHRKNRGEDVR